MTDFNVWLTQSPLAKCEGDEFTITDTLVGGTTISAIASKIYLGSTDKTTENMPTGSGSYSGNVYTTPTIKLLKGGNDYVIATLVTIDGVKTTRKCVINAQKNSQLQ